MIIDVLANVEGAEPIEGTKLWRAKTVAREHREMVEAPVSILVRWKVVGVTISCEWVASDVLTSEDCGAPTGPGPLRQMTVDAHECATRRLANRECLGHQGQNGGIQGIPRDLYPRRRSRPSIRVGLRFFL
jgi:hypothetical protein